MQSEWLWDDLYDNCNFTIDPKLLMDLSTLRLFAIDPQDLLAIDKHYTEVPQSLPPLPFYTCWFEATDHKTPLIDLASRKNPKDRIGLHGILIAGSDTFGYQVGFFFKEDNKWAHALTYAITPNLQGAWVRGDEFIADDLPSFVWALSELATARGIYMEDVIPSRATRRRYERKGSSAPPRKILIIGSPNYASTPRGGSREYSCRWWVRGHWRQVSPEREVWVRAHVKGPVGMPWREPPPKYVLSGDANERVATT